ncbi:hypothetical protein V6N13_058789 [Hibiscus sabdariffa]
MKRIWRKEFQKFVNSVDMTKVATLYATRSVCNNVTSPVPTQCNVPIHGHSNQKLSREQSRAEQSRTEQQIRWTVDVSSHVSGSYRMCPLLFHPFM